MKRTQKDLASDSLNDNNLTNSVGKICLLCYLGTKAPKVDFTEQIVCSCPTYFQRYEEKYEK